MKFDEELQVFDLLAAGTQLLILLGECLVAHASGIQFLL
jgi:hypothetical protein